jgi:hypothetical protein
MLPTMGLSRERMREDEEHRPRARGSPSVMGLSCRRTPSNIIGMFRINAQKSPYPFRLLLSFFPATINDFSDSEMEVLCRLVSIFSGGLPGGSLFSPRNNTDAVFKMWSLDAKNSHYVDRGVPTACGYRQS